MFLFRIFVICNCFLQTLIFLTKLLTLILQLFDVFIVSFEYQCLLTYLLRLYVLLLQELAILSLQFLEIDLNVTMQLSLIDIICLQLFILCEKGAYLVLKIDNKFFVIAGFVIVLIALFLDILLIDANLILFVFDLFTMQSFLFSQLKVKLRDLLVESFYLQ